MTTGDAQHTTTRVRVCVLQPDYRSSGVDYRYFDPPRDLSPWLPDATVHHEVLDKRTVYRQLQTLRATGFDIFVNLCEGYLDWDVPSVDVIHALEQLNLPYTGPTAALYDPPKALMKYVAFTAGVATPRHALVTGTADCLDAGHAGWRTLPFPLFVKPAHAGDSRGISDASRVTTPDALRETVGRLLPEFPELLVEEYIEGREFTVLVAATPDGEVRTFPPVEYHFGDGPPFKTYALKTSALHPDANRVVEDGDLGTTLRDAAARIFRAFRGVGYARCDFRMDRAGTLYFLEINFTCSVFYPDDAAGSADHILRADPMGHAGFLALIIAEGVARHRARQPRVQVRGDATAGYGTFALTSFTAGEVIFPGEHQPLPVVTAAHVAAQWSAEQRETFRRYAYPLAPGLYATWHEDAERWRPQNHSCAANTAFQGLDVIAARDIAEGEELTIDYATALDETAAPFVCRCGAPGCRGTIRGTPGNSRTTPWRADAPV